MGSTVCESVAQTGSGVFYSLLSHLHSKNECEQSNGAIRSRTHLFSLEFYCIRQFLTFPNYI